MVEQHGKMLLSSRTVLLNILLFIVGTQLAVTDGGKVHGVMDRSMIAYLAYARQMRYKALAFVCSSATADVSYRTVHRMFNLVRQKDTASVN